MTSRISTLSASPLSSPGNVDRTTRRCRLQRCSNMMQLPSRDDGVAPTSPFNRMTQPRGAKPDESSGIALKAASATPTSRIGPLSFRNMIPRLCRRTHRGTMFSRLQSFARGLRPRRCKA
eukprot:2037505-Pyramimonas_sp.AAC.1